MEQAVEDKLANFLEIKQNINESMEDLKNIIEKQKKDLLRDAATKIVESKDKGVKIMIEKAVRQFLLLDKFEVNYYLNQAIYDSKMEAIERAQTIEKNKQWRDTSKNLLLDNYIDIDEHLEEEADKQGSTAQITDDITDKNILGVVDLLLKKVNALEKKVNTKPSTIRSLFGKSKLQTMRY